MKAQMPVRLEIAPVAKPRMTRRDTWKKRNCVTEYRAYCDILRKMVRENDLKIDWDNLSLVFGIPVPRSWAKDKKYKMEGTPCLNKPDIDNLIKGFMDALLKEDSNVHYVSASKVWAQKGYVRVGILI